MPSTHSLRLGFAIVVAVVACWPVAAQKKGSVTSPTPVLLPELRGTVNSQPSDVNDDGVIVGTMWDGANIGTAVAWVPNGTSWKIVKIGSGPHPDGPFAHAINNVGEIILNSSSGETMRAAVYTLNVYTLTGDEVLLPIPTFTPGAVGTYAEAINDDGVVLGSALYPKDPATGGTPSERVLWVRNESQWTAVALDAFCDHNDPGVRCQYLNLSKTSRWIAGDVGRPQPNGLWGWAARGSIGPDGVVSAFTPLGHGGTILSNPPQPPLSGAMAVNGKGQCSGYVWPCAPLGNDCASQAAFWDISSNTIPLPTYQAFANRTAAHSNGINDGGDVVGWATFARGGTQEQAAAWWRYPAQPPVRLGTPSGYQTAEATAISNKGLVVGRARGSRPRAIAWRLY